MMTPLLRTVHREAVVVGFFTPSITLDGVELRFPAHAQGYV